MNRMCAGQRPGYHKRCFTRASDYETHVKRQREGKERGRSVRQAAAFHSSLAQGTELTGDMKSTARTGA